uniref:Uncharacterized protein n=1 Tax=Ciona intestinalis TaxID=7719 RepID=F6PI97_CIOIN
MDRRLLTILLIGLVCLVKQGESGKTPSLNWWKYNQQKNQAMQKAAEDYYYDQYYLEKMMNDMPVDDHPRQHSRY